MPVVLEPLPAVTGAQDASLVAGIKQQQARTSHVQMAKHSCISDTQGLRAPGKGHTPLLSVSIRSCTGFTFILFLFLSFFLNSCCPLEAQIKSVDCGCACVFKLSFPML